MFHNRLSVCVIGCAIALGVLLRAGWSHAQVPGVDPQVAQLVMVLNNALKSDMPPAFRESFDREFVENVLKPMQQSISWNFVQESNVRMQRLIDYHKSQSGDDHHRAAVSLLLSQAGMSGM